MKKLFIGLWFSLFIGLIVFVSYTTSDVTAQTPTPTVTAPPPTVYWSDEYFIQYVKTGPSGSTTLQAVYQTIENIPLVVGFVVEYKAIVPKIDNWGDTSYNRMNYAFYNDSTLLYDGEYWSWPYGTNTVCRNYIHDNYDDYVQTNLPMTVGNCNTNTLTNTGTAEFENLNKLRMMAGFHEIVYGTLEIRIRLLIYGIPPEEEPERTCADDYTLGEALTTSAVNSASSAGQIIEMPIAPGEFYALEFLEPAWIDNGATQASYEADLAVMWPPTPPLADWVHLKEWPGVCIEDLGSDRYRAYFQGDILTDLGFYGIRAHDMEEVDNYINNNGDLSYTLFNAAYTPLPSACSASMTTMALRNSAQIWTDRPGGYPLPLHGPLEPNLWYALEVKDFPFFDNGNPAFGLEISEDNGVTWQDIETWAYCVNQTAWNSWTYYFQGVAGVWLKIRAHDGNGVYWDNSGVLNYNLYYAWNFTPPLGGDCSSSFTLGSLQGTYSVPANKQLGTSITDKFTADSWYALEMSSPAWIDQVGVASLSADITRDPPDALPWQTWHNLTDWAGAACVEMVDTDYARIYFKAQSPLSYYLRAHAADNNWTNNSGNVTYKVYGVTAADPEAPPSSCEANYNAGFWVGTGEIYATLSEGQVIKLVSGRTYRLETYAGPWYDDGAPRYGVEISRNGGSDWASLENSAIAGTTGCIVPLADGVHIRVYFTAGSGDYRLRVHDQNSNFGDNSGSIGYKLYIGEDLTDDDGELPPSWNVGCSALCNRPEGILEIANWLEYGRCEAFKFISWCDYHSAAISGVQDMFISREPFNTIMEFRNMTSSIENEFKSYDWGSDTGGFDTSQAPASISSIDVEKYLPALPPDSPYNNGKINLQPGGHNLTTQCTTEMSKAVGLKLSGSICLALDAMNNLGVTPWIQFLFDASLLSIFVLYVYKLWIKPGVGS